MSEWDEEYEISGDCADEDETDEELFCEMSGAPFLPDEDEPEETEQCHS